MQYFGFLFSKNVMKSSVSKILPLKEAERPQDIKGVRNYLGMINYLKRFIPDFSTLTYPIRKLTHQEIKFEWSDDCEKSFQTLNDHLTEKAVNTYFDENKTLLFTVMYLLSDYPQFYCKRTKITMPTLYLIHLVLQLQLNKSIRKLNANVLSLISACKRHHIYVFGRKFRMYAITKH